MHKGIVFVYLWALAGSSYIPDNGQFVHSHIHVPQTEEVSWDAADVASQSGLKIVSGVSDVLLQEIASYIEIDPTHGADPPQDFILNEAKARLSDITILERLLRASGRKETNQSEHRKRENPLKSVDMLKTKLHILPQESKAFNKNTNAMLNALISREWRELYRGSLGVSWASFEYRGMNLSYQNVSKTDLTVTLTIANVGDAPGNEVVECYISWANKSLPVPREQLVHFDNIHLDVNQNIQYAFTLSWMSWAFWNNGTWAVQTG
ncbi:hypothetical protein BsWGS_07436 [Bradybaena similaris]